MGKFRDLLERDLEIRGYSEGTRRAYVSHLTNMARYLNRAPDQISLDDIYRYQLHLTRERKLAWGTFNR